MGEWQLTNKTTARHNKHTPHGTVYSEAGYRGVSVQGDQGTGSRGPRLQ